jgi:undecaprenyl-diphosphatase
MGFDAHQALYLPYLYVMMQLGAICAGFLILSSHLKTLVRGLTQGEHEGKHLLACLILAFIPTGAAGLLLASFIKPIQAVAVLPLTLAAGGMIMLAVEFLYKKRNNLNPQPLRQLSFWQALVIGGCQALSLVPGMSRSMTSIAGGYCVGLGRKDAVVFSFLLGIVTIGAASCYELIAYLLSDAPTIPLSAWAVALLASFLTALTVASGWLQLLIRYGLVPFALYRFLVAAWIYTLCG